MTWLERLGFERMSDAEHRANLDGLNLLFGAVLGVVMATTERLGVRDFAIMLFMTATAVVTILYASSGRRKWLYAALSAAFVYALPRVAAELVSDPAGLPPKLQATLAVWLGMIVFVELMPREKPTPPPG